MLDLRKIFIAGMKWSRGLLWVAAPEERLVATYDLSTGETERRLSYEHEVWDLCPDERGLWMMTAGGKLGRQVVLWSLEEGRELGRFHCPDGAGSGLALYDGKLWITHRRNRKLFCLDPKGGRVNWVIRTENETFSPAAYGSELWLIECAPGPLGHWSEGRQERYFFSRFDPARERVTERLAVSFIPSCMAYDGERFWYAEKGKGGFRSAKKDLGQL